MAGKSLLSRIAGKLLSKSAYLRAPWNTAVSLDTIAEPRSRLGGQISQRPTQRTRWLMGDRESAIIEADSGNLMLASLLWRSIMTDGTFAGALGTRTAGISNLPKRFRGDQGMIDELQLGHESVRSVFDEMLPPDELSAMLRECIGIGIAVGELRPVEGRDYPVLRRLDPTYAFYRWAEGVWYYNSNFGPIPITPGDGRWVLMTLGTEAPWQLAIWQYASRAWLTKEHATLMGAAYEKCLANPARVAEAPAGSTEIDREDWFNAIAAWGVDTIMMSLPGYTVKLLESQGTGWQAFQKTIARCDTELLMAANGQTVTATGGTGFINGDLFKNVAQALIKHGADLLAYTINTQCIPQWVGRKYGVEAIDYGPCVEYDSKPPADLAAAANALTAFSTAVKSLSEAVKPYGYQADIKELKAQYGAAIVPLPPTDQVSWTKAEVDVITATLAAAQNAGLTPNQESAIKMLAKSGLTFEPAPPPPAAPTPGSPSPSGGPPSLSPTSPPEPQALAVYGSSFRADASFKEGEHPRDHSDGEFTTGAGDSAKGKDNSSNEDDFKKTDHEDFTLAGVKVPDAAAHAKIQARFKEMFKEDLSVGKLKELLGVEGLIPGGSVTYRMKPHGAAGIEYQAAVWADGKVAVMVKRQISSSYEHGLNGQPAVHHDLMVVHKDFQAAGTGTKLFEKQVELYRKMGVAMIDTDAAWVGQYQWAKLGYEAQEPKQLEALKKEFYQYLTGCWVKKEDADKVVAKIKSLNDLAGVQGKSPFEIPTGEGFEGLKDSDAHKWGKLFLIQRGACENAELIPMKFDLREKSKSLKTLARVLIPKPAAKKAA